MFVRLLGWICRVALAAVFLYAGFTKLQNLSLFMLTVDTYQLLPASAVIAVAYVLPWLELALGALLLVGWKLRYVVTFTGLLLTAFIAAMAVTYFRGIEADCGCFGFGEPISPFTLGRDSILWLMAVFLVVRAWGARSAPVSHSG